MLRAADRRSNYSDGRTGKLFLYDVVVDVALEVLGGHLGHLAPRQRHRVAAAASVHPHHAHAAASTAAATCSVAPSHAAVAPCSAYAH